MTTIIESQEQEDDNISQIRGEIKSQADLSDDQFGFNRTYQGSKMSQNGGNQDTV